MDQHGNLKNSNDFYVEVDSVQSDFEIFIGEEGHPYIEDERAQSENKMLEEENAGIEVEPDDIKDIKVQIPLYYLMDLEDTLTEEFPLTDARIGVYGIKRGETIIPYVIGHLGSFVPGSVGTIGALDPYELEWVQGNSTYWENKQLNKAVGEYLEKRGPLQSSIESQRIRFNLEEETKLREVEDELSKRSSAQSISESRAIGLKEEEKAQEK